MEETKTGSYKILNSIEYNNPEGAGTYEAGSIQVLPTEIGDAFVASGDAEKVEEDSSETAESTADAAESTETSQNGDQVVASA